jgi:hypothetical protein
MVARCPDCKMGPVICLERKRLHRLPEAICIHAKCLACDYEGSIVDYGPEEHRLSALGKRTT